MTLTAPIPMYDLAAEVRAGRPVTATARVEDTVHDAIRAVRAAISRNLQALDLTADDGILVYDLHRDPHGWLLTGTWQAL